MPAYHYQCIGCQRTISIDPLPEGESYIHVPGGLCYECQKAQQAQQDYDDNNDD